MKALAYIATFLSVLALGGVVYLSFNQPEPAEPADDTATGALNSYTQAVVQARGFVHAGGTFATSSVGASTLGASSIANAHIIERSGTGALTMTLPASTTLGSFLPKTRDTSAVSRTIYIVNAGTAALTIAGGTGTLLDSASTTAIGAGGTGRLDFLRKSNGDINVLFTHGI